MKIFFLNNCQKIGLNTRFIGKREHAFWRTRGEPPEGHETGMPIIVWTKYKPKLFTQLLPVSHPNIGIGLGSSSVCTCAPLASIQYNSLNKSADLYRKPAILWGFCLWDVKDKSISRFFSIIFVAATFYRNFDATN